MQTVHRSAGEERVRAVGSTHQGDLAALLSSGVSLSSTSSIPLYHQLHLVLQRGIREVGLQVGDRFPSEEAIARAFSVSRPTASRAIQELANRGRLVRKRGRGTFVHGASLTQFSLLNSHLSFADEMAEHADYSSRVVSKSLTTATSADAEALAVPVSASLIWLRRLHKIEDRPVMVCDSRLSAARFPGLEKRALTEGSLYRTLDEVYGCAVRRAERWVEASELLDDAIAELLGVPLFAPVLELTGLAFAADSEVVEHMAAYVREGVTFKNVIAPGQATEPAP